VTYKPNPLDTSKVKLPKRIYNLIDRIAENNHDVWAQKIINEGWKYGSKRNDIKKENPYLVPYQKLPKHVKEYDRIIAIEVLKTITTLGYKLVPDYKEFQTDSDFIERALKDSAINAKSFRNSDLRNIVKLWSLLSAENFISSPKAFEMLGNRALELGEPLLAYDILTAGTKCWPQNLKLKKLLGLALARSGATKRANKILSKLYETENINPETLGILARTHKDLAANSINIKGKEKHLKTAYKYYKEAYERSISNKKGPWMDDAIYNGINAATTALLTSKKNKAKNLARDTKDFCLKRLKRKKQDYWAVASLGEAALILGDLREAEARFFSASELGQGNLADLSSTRRQARVLLGHLGLDRNRLDHCFSIPKIVIFAGPVIDRPEQSKPFFNQIFEKSVRKEIATKLKKIDGGIGYSSAACGSEILFLEEIIKRNGEANIVLPFQKDGFKLTHVNIIPGSNWNDRFNNLLNSATNIIIASEHKYSKSKATYEYCNILKHGLAVLRAKILDTEIIPMAVWDGRQDDGQNETDAFIDYWASRKIKPDIIHIAELSKQNNLTINTIESPKATLTEKRSQEYSTANLSQDIKAMLFADVVGYGKLSEEIIPNFVQHFMGLVAELIEKSSYKPVTKNTWGDSFYLVFPNIKKAGHFALQLRDSISKTNWKIKDLPENLNIRISLHAGPVYYFKDPVLKKYKFTGSHVSRAARIEPITPPGEIYVSQEFAAIASAQGIRDFTFEYAGQVPLPKESDTVRLYILQRGNIDADAD
jgi:class 3 adenylate cyclase